jgi:hypothetical protein
MQDLRAAAPATEPKQPQRGRSGRSTQPPQRGRVVPPAAAPARAVRATFHLPAALVDEAKNAVVALSGPPWRLTLAGLMRDALAREIERLKDAYHAGEPWPRRSATRADGGSGLVGGRPLKG